MHDSPDFLTAIQAAPEDDTPRLVYADWLEEHGEAPRAELIRVQCELAQLPWYAERHAWLADREQQLLSEHKNRWLGNFRDIVRSARFVRGFVESVALDAKQFSQHAESIFARAPVRKASLLQVSDRAAKAVGQTESLVQIDELVVPGNRLREAGWRSILMSPYLTGLATLEFSLDTDASQSTVLSFLAKSPSLTRLVAMRVSRLHLDDRETQRAFRSLSMPSLRALTLPTTHGDALRQLHETRLIPQLVELDLTGNHLNSHRLLEKFGLTARELKMLRLNGGSMFDREIVRLCRGDQFPSLEELDIRFNHLTDESLGPILTGLPRLKRLTVNHLQFQGEMRPLRNAAKIANLDELAINGVYGMTESHIATLLSRLSLRKLTLDHCELTDAAVESLSRLPNANDLLWLDLTNNELTDKASEAIVASPYLDNLRYLSLRENAISLDQQQALRSKYGPGTCAFSV